jgi:Raf kinase inhibitor-like YbhB/YbcL family protein
MKNLSVTSEAFAAGGNIPAKYTCDGEAVSPPLTVDNIPEHSKTLAIIVEDPDAPHRTFDHWLLWNLPPDRHIKEDRVLGASGKNSAGKTGYYPPCPPSGSHRYYFTVFALDTSLSLQEGSDKQKLKAAMEDHILAQGVIMGRYQKKSAIILNN